MFVCLLKMPYQSIRKNDEDLIVSFNIVRTMYVLYVRRYVHAEII